MCWLDDQSRIRDTGFDADRAGDVFFAAAATDASTLNGISIKWAFSKEPRLYIKYLNGLLYIVMHGLRNLDTNSKRSYHVHVA